MKSMQKVGVLFNPRIEAAKGLALEIAKTLGKLQNPVWICPTPNEREASEQLTGTEMILSLGGDGTILRVARLVAPAGIPILGVNMGSLGFTTELTSQEALSKIPRFLQGEGWIDERTMLQAELPSHTGSPILHALNDVVVARGEFVRVIQVKTSVNREPITTYKADGVIVATATGSTGYSLSAGGPIIFPAAKELLLTPIMSHLGLTTALVLSSESVVELEVQTAHQARISIDGQIEFPLQSGDVIKISRSPYTARLLRIQPRTFFHQTLLQRLSGKGG
ncbi:MAG: NAD(+)/NADH kinase [Dehalococcoidia bacterium]|nr:NAD(+)/NADH kinase [Dehalococcoidia bacterium]